MRCGKVGLATDGRIDGPGGDLARHALLQRREIRYARFDLKDYMSKVAPTDADIEAYYKAQGLFGMPAPGELNYTKIVKLDLGSVVWERAGADMEKNT